MKRLSRRTFLRGLGGAALALPLLEVMGDGAARAAEPTFPRRILFVFTANGDQPSRRFKTSHPTGFVFDEFLAPLEPYRDELLILNKLNKRFSKLPTLEKADSHQQGGSGLAPWPSGEGSYPVGGSDRKVGYVLGPSADYAIGDRVLKNAPVPYRHLVQRVGGKSNNIWNLHSHAGPEGTQNPVPPETDPWKAYASLFSFLDPAAHAKITQRLARQQSALDLVLGETESLSKRLGNGDRIRLEQHTESLRDIERKLDSTAGGLACAPFDPGSALDAHADENHELVGSLFFDIDAMAFACDLTRVVSFNWSGNTSNRVYKNLGMTEGHHDISHESGDAAYAKVRKIKQHLWTLNTKLYEKLKAIPEGAGSVWDNTLIVHWDELGDGNPHSTNDQLVVFAGGGSGYFAKGRLVECNNEVGFADMLVSCFHYMGFEDVTSFGDARLNSGGPVPGIKA